MKYKYADDVASASADVEVNVNGAADVAKSARNKHEIFCCFFLQ